MLEVARHQLLPGTRPAGDEDRRRVRTRRAREQGVQRLEELPCSLAVPDDLGTVAVLEPPPSSLGFLDSLLTRDVQGQGLAQGRRVGGQPLAVLGSEGPPRLVLETEGGDDTPRERVC